MQRLNMVTLHQGLIQEFPICGVSQLPLTKDALIFRKIVKGMGWWFGGHVTFLLDIHNPPCLDGGNGDEAVLISIEIGESLLAWNAFESPI